MQYANIKTLLPFFLLTLCYGISIHSTNNRSTPDAAGKKDAHKLHVLLERKRARSKNKRVLKRKVVTNSKNKSIIVWKQLPIAWTVLPGNGLNN